MKDNSTGKAYSVSNLDGSFCGLEASVDSQVVVSHFDEGWINQLQLFNLLSETIFIHDISEVKHWSEGNHSMPHGISMIKIKGEANVNWDSTAYNMILVNEWLEAHFVVVPNALMFPIVLLLLAYVVHVP